MNLQDLALRLYIERTNNQILRSQHAENPNYILSQVERYLPICINEAKAIISHFEGLETYEKTKSKKDVKKNEK